MRSTLGWVALVATVGVLAGGCGARSSLENTDRLDDDQPPVSRSKEGSEVAPTLAPGLVLESALDSDIGVIKCGSVEVANQTVDTYCTLGKCCSYDDGTAFCRLADYDCSDDEHGWPLPLTCDGTEDCPTGQACYLRQVMSVRNITCSVPPRASSGQGVGRMYQEVVRQVCNPNATADDCLATETRCRPCSTPRCATNGHCVRDDE